MARPVYARPERLRRALVALSCVLLLLVAAQGARAQGTFTPTGSLNVAHLDHTATLLPDGKVLIAGGGSDTELYDPVTGTFAQTGNLNGARSNHTATLLPNGKVLIAGGLGSSRYLASAELYDPATGIFTLTGSLSVGRWGHTATLLPNGQVLIAGGATASALASAELYDPETGTFTQTGSLNIARYSHTATLLPSGKVLIAGGHGSSTLPASAELYDPATGRFTPTGSLNIARNAHSATLLLNGRVLIAGGAGFSGYPVSAELYDPATGTFTLTGSLNIARADFTATLLPGGDVVVVGGDQFDRVLGRFEVFATGELYDPATGTFTLTGSLNIARINHTATLLANGELLIAGGFDFSSSLASAELFSLTTTPTITWPTPADISYGTPLGPTELNATADVPGTFTYDPPAGTVLGTGANQELSVTFTPTDTTLYTTATGSVSINVLKAAPKVTWAAPVPIAYGTALGSAQLAATADVPGTFAYTPPAGTVLGAGGQTLSVTFTPADSADYDPVTTNVVLQVTRASPAVSWPTPAAIVYGTALGSTQLDASADVPGTFSYSPPADTVLHAGTVQPLTVTFTPDDATDYTTVTDTVSISVLKATPELRWTPPAAIVYGTPLGPIQLDATSNVSGTFSYTPPAGSLLNAGTGQPLEATFVPIDSADYTTTSIASTISVSPAVPIISITGGPFTYDGQPQGATVTAMGINGTSLGPVVVTYNGSASAPVDAGTYAVVASVAASPNYTAASSTGTLTINKAPAQILLSGLSRTYTGRPLSPLVATDPTNLSGVSITYPDGTHNIPIDAGTYAVTATLTNANYAAPPVTATFVILPAPPTLSVTSGTFTYDGLPHAATAVATGLDGESLGPIALTYNGALDAPIHAGSYTVRATLAASQNYSAAIATGTLLILKATPLLAWPTPAPIVYGTPLDVAQLNATAAVAGSFTYLPPAGTVVNVGSTTLSVIFTPADLVDFTTATATVPLTVLNTYSRFVGDGRVESDQVDRTVQFAIRTSPADVAGRLAYRVRPEERSAHGRQAHDDNGIHSKDRFDSDVITAAAVVDSPEGEASAGRKHGATVNGITISGTGRWNGVAGYTFTATALDAAEKGRPHDHFSITIRDAAGAVVDAVDADLTTGRIESLPVRALTNQR